jgi:dTDP-4-dehydrorhamnose reductase
MILILGATGYVGSALCNFLEANKEPYTTYAVRFPFDRGELKRHIIKNSVDAVINCAGFTGKPNVDECEKEGLKIECLNANALLPHMVAEVCNDLRCRLVHVSSGCIFTDAMCDKGHRPSFEFTEDDKPNFTFTDNNCSWYSGTKALGEHLLGNDACIARLRIPFNGDINPRNYISKLIQYPKLLNATNSFSQLDEFVAGLFQLSTAYFNGPINLTQPGYMTTIEVVELLRKYNLLTSNKDWFESPEEFLSHVIAPRSNCVLDSSKAYREGIKLTPIQDAMEEAISKYAYNLKK